MALLHEHSYSLKEMMGEQDKLHTTITLRWCVFGENLRMQRIKNDIYAMHIRTGIKTQFTTIVR